MTPYNGVVFASLAELLIFMNTSGLAMPVPINKSKIINIGFDAGSNVYFLIYEVV